jgi:spore germination protein
MEYPRQITVIQGAAILISTIIGVGVLPLPRFAVEAADTGAPLVTFLGLLLACIGLGLITLLGMRFPNKSIVQYSEDILGKWTGRLGSVFIISFFAILTALAAREFGEVVIASVLRRTPLEVTVIVMLLLAAISSRHNVTVFAYIHHFYFPLVLAPALVIIILSLKNGDALNLQPVWGNEPKGIWMGVLTVAALFQGSFIFTLVIPAMRRPEKAMKAALYGISIAGGLYLAIVMATVAVFGPEETEQLLWPTLELARTTALPAAILERLDAIFLIVWVTAVFTTLFSSYFLTIHSITQLFQLRDHKMFSLFVIPIIFFLAMIPQNAVQMYQFIEFVGRAGLVITIAYPALLLGVAWIRKLREDQREGKTLE